MISAAGQPADRPTKLQQAELIAAVAARKRNGLLRYYRHTLSQHDLEDCIGQAVLELLTRVKRGERFSSVLHVDHALEQKVRSRVSDQLRARAGRSPLAAALERALRLTPQVAATLPAPDPRPGVEETVLARVLLERVAVSARSLTHKQRQALAASLGGAAASPPWREAGGCASDRERKQAQRARRRLRALALEGWDG